MIPSARLDAIVAAAAERYGEDFAEGLAGELDEPMLQPWPEVPYHVIRRAYSALRPETWGVNKAATRD